jgi:hypothetical protein
MIKKYFSFVQKLLVKKSACHDLKQGVNFSLLRFLIKKLTIALLIKSILFSLISFGQRPRIS